MTTSKLLLPRMGWEEIPRRDVQAELAWVAWLGAYKRNNKLLLRVLLPWSILETLLDKDNCAIDEYQTFKSVLQSKLYHLMSAV